MRRSGATAERVARLVRIVVAVIGALVVSEAVLRWRDLPHGHARECSCDNEASIPDERAGWVWRAEFTKDVVHGGRTIHYEFDRHHDRASSTAFVEDPDAPTIVLVGESILVGHGLYWQESLPALLGDALHVQVVDLGVTGFGSDQAFMRLVDALPRLHNVVAVVTIFFPTLVERISWRDRPRLSFDGHVPVVQPPQVSFWENMRLVRLLRDVEPLETSAIALAGRIYLETDRLAKERGARALFVAPFFPKGWPRGDASLVGDLFVKQGLEVLQPDWKFESLPNDEHPNAATTRRLADALVQALRTR